jgi:hypothetical protein
MTHEPLQDTDPTSRSVLNNEAESVSRGLQSQRNRSASSIDQFVGGFDGRILKKMKADQAAVMVKAAEQ